MSKSKFNLKKFILISLSSIVGTVIVFTIGFTLLLNRAVDKHVQQHAKIVEELDTFTKVSQFAEWSEDNDIPVYLTDGEKVTIETEELVITGYHVNKDFSVGLETSNLSID